MEMQAIAGTYGIERGSVLAIAAGADAICVGGGLADEDDRPAAARRPGRGGPRRANCRRSAWPTRPARVRALAALDAAGTAGRAAGGGRARARHRPRRRPAAPCAVTGRRHLRAAHRAPYVAALTPVANIAVGDETPWGVAAELRRLLPGTETAHLHRRKRPPRPARRPGRRPARPPPAAASSPWSATSTATPGWPRPCDALLAARPDTVVVEMGLSRSAAPRRPPHRHPRRRPGLRPARRRRSSPAVTRPGRRGSDDVTGPRAPVRGESGPSPVR